MSALHVALMASAVGKVGGVTWHHLFLLASDASGKQRCLRAGPQCLPVESVAGRRTQHGAALEDYEPSPAGPYGVITFSEGAYKPGGVDFDPAAADVTVTDGPGAAPLWEKLLQAAEALQAEQIPYDPTGKGANWAIVEALRRCGVQAQLPPKRWAPGAAFAEPAAMPKGVSARRLGEAVVR